MEDNSQLFHELNETEGLDGPGPLILDAPVLPSNARQVVRDHDGQITLSFYMEGGLEFLEAVFDLVTTFVVRSSKADIRLLSEMPQLEDLTIDGSIRKFPQEIVWKNLSGFSGPWQRGVEPFIAAPHLRGLDLRRATQDALELVSGPLDQISLTNAKISHGSSGWKYPATNVYIDRTKSLEVGNFALLPAANFIVFENIGELHGLSEVSKESPLNIVQLRGVKSLGQTDPWSIRARGITVGGSRSKPEWLAEAWPARPADWQETWEPPHGWNP